MAMNKKTFKDSLKNDLISIFEACNSNKGLTTEEYADRLSDAIANVITYIKTDAEVQTTVTGTAAGTYPVTAKGEGKVL